MKKKNFRNMLIGWGLLSVMLLGDFLMPQMQAKVYAEEYTAATASLPDIPGAETADQETPTSETVPETPAAATEDSTEAEPATEVTTEATTEAPDPYSSQDAVRQQTVYYWHKGLPPQDGKEYPVLLVWDDKYYLQVDNSFLDSVKRASYGLNNATMVDNGFTAIGLTNGGFNGNGGYPNGNYSIQIGYPAASGSNLISDLDFDYNVLKSTGSAMTYTLPSVPVMRRLSPVPANIPAGEKQEEMAERVLIGIRTNQQMIDSSHTSAVFKVDEPNWLTAFKYMDYAVYEDSFLGISYDYRQTRIFRWYLRPINEYTIASTQERYRTRNWTADADFVNKNLDTMAWNISIRNDQYVFSSTGFAIEEKNSRISGSFDDWRKLESLSQRMPNIILGHTGADFCSYGNRDSYRHNWISVNYAADTPSFSKFQFDVYYAEPNLMYFLNSDIVVEKGQVQNLDGPLVIEDGTKIIVEDGGVLSFTDWIINNGEIMIEPGGSMIIQKAEAGKGTWVRNGVVVSSEKDTGKASGRISCDGIMIVMPDCTIAGNGIYGLEFGEGAQCVNYGSLVSENWNIYTDHTIENRGDKSRVYLGWTVIDMGFSLTNLTLDQNISSLGNWRTHARITYPDNAFYGRNGALYYNSSTYQNWYVHRSGNQRGRVTPIRLR